MNTSDTTDRTELLKTAYRKMADLRAQLAAVGNRDSEPVAIVGMSCRMPGGAESPDAFWELLKNGTDGTSEIPADRWDVDDYYDPDPEAPNKMYVRRGGFTNNYRGFDPLFFHVSPVEAASMDPQQRILLEMTWEALENAGWAPDRLAGTQTGVFVGTSGSDFGVMSVMAAQKSSAQTHMATGISPSITAGHLSYFLGLRGPCMALDTACSSALTAIHQACESLRKGESNAAIAGAISLVISPVGNLLVCKARMLAPDGHCKTFDASADGYARSEGGGVVILKLLSKALADGDRILGVIRGSACNQDGRTNGITAPSGNAQREVVLAAQAAANVTPAEIDYVETHGTGTRLGDPIEVQALGEVFGPGRPADSKLILGAVKSNIGHLECAAGMAAIIKATLVLQNGEIPPNLHFNTPNPHIPWDRLPFTVPTALMPWRKSGATRKAGVSAFGFSGTNVHMVLEESPTLAERTTGPDRQHHMLILSGQSSSALLDLAARYFQHFEHHPELDLGDVCFTAAVGRSHFSHRVAIVADSIAEMRDKLGSFVAAPEASGDHRAGVVPHRAPGAALLLGRMAANMTAPYSGFETYQQALAICQNEAANLGASASVQTMIEDITRAYATATLWLDWGISPSAMSGVGEIILAAAAAAGALSVQDALRLAIDRNAPVSWLTPAIMLLDPTTGLALDLKGLRELLQASVHTVPPAFGEALQVQNTRVGLLLGDGPFLSSDGFDIIAVHEAGWAGILDGLGKLYTAGIAIDWDHVEALWHRRRVALPTYPFQRQECWLEMLSQTSAVTTPVLQQAPALHPLLGRRVHAASFKNKLVFETVFSAGAMPLLNDHQFYSTPVVSMSTLLELAAAGGRMCYGDPAVVEDATVEQPLMLPAGQSRLVQIVFAPQGDNDFEFEILSADDASLNDNPAWDRHCTGRVRRDSGDVLAKIDTAEFSLDRGMVVEPDWFYDTVSRSGVDYGPSFRLMQDIRRDEKSILARLALPTRHAREAEDYSIHPGLLDAAIQAFGLGASIDSANASESEQDVFMPIGVGRFALAEPAGAEIWCRATILEGSPVDGDAFAGDVQLYANDGRQIGELTAVQFKRSSKRQLTREMDERRLRSWLYDLRWERLDSLAPSPVKSDQHWLIIGAESGQAASLSAHLERAGMTISVAILEGAGFQKTTDGIFHVPPRSAPDLDQLLLQVQASGPVHGIAYIANGETQAGDPPISTQAQGKQLLDLAQSLQRTGITSLDQLGLITRGFRTPSIADAIGLSAGAVWGMGRVISSEFPDLNCRLFDFDPALSHEELAERAALELFHVSAENQIAVERNDRFGLRLGRAETAVPASNSVDGVPYSGAVQLAIGARGDLRQLHFIKQEPGLPKAGEVRLRVLATAMNFRDVLNVLGMYPGDPGNPGVECVGEVVAIGPGVEGFALGEHVLAIPEHGYCTFANAPVNMVFKRPDDLSLAGAATLLVAYLTATYGLNHLSGMKAGERVLIHAGAGGVGLAAIQLAKRAGAEIFATAGSPAKRAYLREIGVDHVLDSRSLDFVDAIRSITQGEGIDLVLNSLTGPAMRESLALLRSGGRFVEIGKTDVYTPEEAHGINPLADYHLIELLAPFQDNAPLMQQLFDDIRDGLKSGELTPLPYRTFGLDEAPQAFRYMSGARHIGKIVVIDRSAPDYKQIASSGCYLITGGLGGLGLTYARWLASEGAATIVLVSRRAPGAEERAAISAIEEMGARVLAEQADIGDRQQVEDLLKRVVTPFTPLRGIIHAAGLIDDGMILSQDHDRFDAVMRPKIDGAWHLHELTLRYPLDFFVLFSSGAGVFGNPGQSSYAVGSVFLDELARARQRAGLPALSIDWGPWAEVGMAARMDKRHAETWGAQGLSTIAPEQGLTLLDMLLRSNRHEQVAVLPLDTTLWQSGSDHVPPLLSGLVKSSVDQTLKSANGESALARLSQAPLADRHGIVVDAITEMVMEIFGLAESRTLSAEQNLTEIGMDSLMAIQLSNRMKSAFSVAMPATIAFQRPMINEIADYVLEQMEPGEADDRPDSSKDDSDAALRQAPGDQPQSAEALLSNLAQLDERDVERLLREMENEDESA